MLQVRVFEKDVVRLDFNQKLLRKGCFVSHIQGQVVDVDAREITVRISPKICLTFSAETRQQILNNGATGGWILTKVIGAA